MNHDPTPSSSASQPPAEHDDAQDTGANPQEAGGRDGSRARSQSVARQAKAGLAKKLQFTTDLMTSLDMVVFAELCVLYYMDCSFFRLIIRSTAQSFFLSPKSEDFLLLMPAHRPHVFAIFLPNVICMLLHIFCSLPEASEATRGYLHGGVLIDFIGQKAPTSRLGLLLLDLVILVVQCFMLSVHSERERLRKIVMPLRRTAATTGEQATGEQATATSTAETPAATVQDHDAEERGTLRDGPRNTDDTTDIEMQPLTSSRRGRDPEGADDHRADTAEGAAGDAAAPNLRDTLSSGNAILADFHIIHAIRTAGNDYQSAAAHSLQTIGYAATLARLAAERRARLEARQRQQ